MFFSSLNSLQILSTSPPSQLHSFPTLSFSLLSETAATIKTEQGCSCLLVLGHSIINHVQEPLNSNLTIAW